MSSAKSRSGAGRSRKPAAEAVRRSGARAPRERTPAPAAWTFLTNHAHVLLCVATAPRSRIQEIAARVGITYRGVQRILDELEEAGYLSRSRDAADARKSVYEVDGRLPLRHPLERHRQVGALLALTSPDEEA